MGVWEERIRRQDRVDVLLVRIELGYDISRHTDDSLTWATHGTYSNVKQLTGFSIEWQNIPRRIRFLSFNGKEYSRLASVSDVQGMQKSYMYDRQQAELNVRPKGSLDLDTAIGTAIVPFYFGTHYKNFKGEKWIGRILPQSGIRNVKLSVGDRYFGPGSISMGGLVMANGDGWFDGMPDMFDFMEARVTAWHGIDLDVPGGEMDFDDYRKFVSGEVSDIYTENDSVFGMELRQVAERARKETATKPHYDSDSSDNDTPTDQTNRASMDKQHEGEVIAHLYGSTDAGGSLTDTQRWEVGMKTRCINKGNALFRGTQFQIARTITNSETDDVHGLKDVAFVMHQIPGQAPVTVPDTSWRTLEDNTIVDFSATAVSGVTTPGYVVNVARGDTIRILGDGYADVSGKFTGNGNAIVEKPQDLIHKAWSHAGLKAREINVPSVTGEGVSKTVTTLLYGATAGATMIRIADEETLDVGYFIEIGTDDNGGDGFEVVAYWDDLVTISPALGISQAAGVNIKCFGTYAEASFHDQGRLLVTKETNWQQIATECMQTIRGVGIPNGSGKMTLIQLDDIPRSTDTVIKKAMMGSKWKDKRSRDSIADVVVVEFGVSPASGTRRQKRNAKTVSIGGKNVNNRRAKARYGRERDDVIQSAAKSGSKAKLLANSCYETYGEPPLYADFDEIFGVSELMLPGQKAILFRDRSLIGEIRRKPFWLLSLDMDVLAHTANLSVLEARA